MPYAPGMCKMLIDSERCKHMLQPKRSLYTCLIVAMRTFLRSARAETSQATHLLECFVSSGRLLHLVSNFMLHPVQIELEVLSTLRVTAADVYCALLVYLQQAQGEEQHLCTRSWTERTPVAIFRRPCMYAMKSDGDAILVSCCR